MQARANMSTLAALRSPDQIAGGGNAIVDFGDRSVNCAIGGGCSSKVGELDAAALDPPPGTRVTTRMHVQLERCK